MDYTQEFSALQGLIVSAANVHPFSRLSEKGGNEEKFDYVIKSLHKFFEDKNYIRKSGINMSSLKELRKLSLFLILSADLEALKEMMDIEELEQVIWTLPTISKCLLCEIFWNLHFDRFVYEAIAFCNPQLGMELATAFIDNLKYYTPQESLKKIKILSAACYRTVCRLNLFNFDDSKLSKLLTVNLNNFQKCLKYFSDPPKAERLNYLSKDDLYKYNGDTLYKMLLLIEDCLDQFTQTQDIYPSDVGDLYTLTHFRDSTRNNFSYKPCDGNNLLINDHLNTCHVALLDKCQNLVMGVSVDIFCAWSEFMENNKSMQHKIGELCHNVRMKLISISSISEHPVVSMIEQIACKPIDLTAIINSTENSAIIENINTGDKVAWLHALVQKENLCLDEDLVNCISTNLDILNQEDSSKLFKILKDLLRSPDSRGDLELLAVRVFQHCDSELQNELLHEYFSNKCFIEMNKTEFVNMSNETFNKLILSNMETENILPLFLQKPKDVYATIFRLASQNVQQKDLMIKVMKSLQGFSDHYYSCDTEPSIIVMMRKSFEELFEESQISNMVHFITGLKEINCVTDKKLLMLIVMPNLHKALLDKDITNLYIQTKLLKSAYKLEELLEYRAPLLAMLAQVLDAARWKINTFESRAPATLLLALELQTSLFDTYLNDIPENESNWLKGKIKNINPLNMYYYRRLWNPQGNNFAEIISGREINNTMDSEQLATWLSQIISSSIQEEWCELWDSLSVFSSGIVLEMFHDAMSLLTIGEGANHTPETWACLLYCNRNFVYVIRYKYLKEPLDDEQVSSVLDIVTITANLTEEENIDDLITILLPLFSYISEKKGDLEMNIPNYLHNKIRHKKFADTIKNVFTSGATSE